MSAPTTALTVTSPLRLKVRDDIASWSFIICIKSVELRPSFTYSLTNYAVV